MAIKALLLLCAATCAFAQSGHGTYRVSLVVSLSDSSLSNRITSAVNRELRKIDDVITVSRGGQWVINISGFKLKSVGGNDTGFVLSATVTQLFDAADWLSVIPEGHKVLRLLIPKYPIFLVDSAVYVGGNGDEETTARNIIAAFDAHVVQPARVSAPEIDKAFRAAGWVDCPARPAACPPDPSAPPQP